MHKIEKQNDLNEWLNTILSIHISADLEVVYAQSDRYYVIKPRQSSLKDGIKINIIDDLWTMGRSDLPCSQYQDLPAPGLAEPVLDIYQDNCFQYDVLGLAFWMLSRAEEVGREDLDHFQRFPATASHAYQHGYLERPIVDEWMMVLREICSTRWPSLRLKQHTFSMKLSHDVDRPSKFAQLSLKRLILTTGKDVLLHRNLSSLFKAPLIYLFGSKRLLKMDPNNTFDWLMEQSEKAGVKSAFYFIMGRTDPRYDAFYDGDERAIRQLMREIHRRGHEIGLHPSFNTYHKPDRIVAEAERLKMACKQEGISQNEWGGRMHYLRWQTPVTIKGWDDAGMSYDSTLSYADHAGFRCGTCREYPAYDPVDHKMLNVYIRPLIAMDQTVVGAGYMGLGHTEAALDKFLDLKNQCKKVNGVFTLLWHNSFFSCRKDFEIYKSILEK